LVSGHHPYFLRARDAGAIRRIVFEVARFGADVVVLEFPFYPGIARPLRATGAFVVADAADDRLNVALGLFRAAPSLAKPRLLAEAVILARSERRFDTLDQIWYAAPAEAERAEQLAPGRVRVVPNVVDVAAIAARAQPTPTYRRSAIFLGSFGYQPNVLGAIRFATSIAPEIRRRDPNARLAIIGQGPTPAIIAAARAGGVEVLANVPDAVAEMSRYGALVAPLSVAGGTRLKLLEAFAAGVPVVATAAAAAGLGARPGIEFVAAERDADIARVTVALWDDFSSANDIRDAARRLVRDRYDIKSANRAVREALAELRPRVRRCM
jgi:glycosyltransferase involved in cell wall biosynthesis